MTDQDKENLNFLNSIPHGVFVFDDKLNLAGYNDAALEILDFPSDLAMIGTPLESHIRFNAKRGIYGEGDVDELVWERMNLILQRQPFDFEFPRSDGRVVKRFGKFDDRGWLTITFTDVGERAKAETEMKRLNELLEQQNFIQDQEIQKVRQELESRSRILQLIIDNISDGVSLISRDKELMLANDRLFELLEMPVEMNRPGLPVQEIYLLEAEKTKSEGQTLQEEAERLEEFAFGSDSSEIERVLHEDKIIKLSRKMVKEGLVTTISDVTSLKKAQKQLEDANKALSEKIDAQGIELDEQRRLADQLLSAIDTSDTSILLFDTNDCLLFANKRYEVLNPEGAKLLYKGIPYREFMQKMLAKGIYPKVGDTIEDYINARIEKLEREGSANLVEKNRFGRWLQIHEHRLPDGSMLSMANDITELKQAEIELEENEERFRDFAEDGADWFWEMNEDLKFSFVTGKVAEIIGITPEDMLGKTRHEVVGLTEETAKSNWNDYLDDVPDEISFTSPTLRVVRPDGEVRYIVTTGKPIYHKDGSFKGYRGVGRDVTDLTRAEEALRRSQKMDAVGQLTGGIAHDFNNILGIVYGNLELLSEQLPEDSPLKAFAENALKGASRASELTHKLLGFSNHHHGSISRVCLNDLIEETNTLMSKSLTASIEIETDLASDLWDVAINKGDFEDSLLNLALNAKDAMPNGGRLVIETKNATLDEKHLQGYSDVVPGKYVMLSFSDDGVGMSREVRERVFEPFFTTKDVGKGTGLGLSMVFGFVKRSGGFINLYSEPGSGTTFKIYLPTAKGTTSNDVREIEINSLPVGNGEKILVVDDEADLLEISAKALKRLGYQVLIADSASKAIEIVQSDEDIDLFFTDVILPGGIDGYRLKDEVLKLRPNIKTLLTSGFTGKQSFKDGNLDKGEERLARNEFVLQKPFTRHELATIVKDVLLS
ncbi:PAS-domain containing protein [Sneathiella limimaris]|uniref:PAS-domain containing protein n=1 Tax=Sneathiella limimaris TaxID=1964213 RepID=UPI00146BF099|nr:PAS-domain containing protein [Sneathiella limimaris]